MEIGQYYQEKSDHICYTISLYSTLLYSTLLHLDQQEADVEHRPLLTGTEDNSTASPVL